MNCIICGRKAELTKMLGDVEAAFCYAHSPGEMHQSTSLQVILTRKISSERGHVELIEKFMLMEV